MEYDNSIQELRTKINILDETIVDLLKKRFDLVCQVREIKHVDKMPQHNLDRENMVIQYAERNCSGLQKEYIHNVYAALMKITREMADKFEAQ